MLYPCLCLHDLSIWVAPTPGNSKGRGRPQLSDWILSSGGSSQPHHLGLPIAQNKACVFVKCPKCGGTAGATGTCLPAMNAQVKVKARELSEALESVGLGI